MTEEIDEVVVSNRRRGGMFTGFLIGGLIGATVALLTAPQPGEQTRRELRDPRDGDQGQGHGNC